MMINDQTMIFRKRQRKVIEIDNDEQEVGHEKVMAKQSKRTLEQIVRKQSNSNFSQLARLNEEDSNSNASFTRIIHKIQKNYPDQVPKNASKTKPIPHQQQKNSENLQKSPEIFKSETRSQKKQKPKINIQEMQTNQTQTYHPRNKSKQTKKEDKEYNENLASEVAIRWWYCMPVWPPEDYQYEKQLKRLGYRLIQPQTFRFQNDLVNGYYKASSINGYPGIFRTKQKLIDIRPKEGCPSLNYFRNKSKAQLQQMLKTCLKNQFSQLKNVKYHRSVDKELLKSLKEKYIKYS